MSDLIQIRYGKDHKILMPGEYPVFGSGGIMRYGNSFLYDKESVLIPRKGTLNNIIYIDEPFWSVGLCQWFCALSNFATWYELA